VLSYRFLSRPESNRKRFRCLVNSARKIKKVCFPWKIKGCGARFVRENNGYLRIFAANSGNTTRIVFTQSCKMRLLFFGNLANFPCSQADSLPLTDFALCIHSVKTVRGIRPSGFSFMSAYTQYIKSPKWRELANLCKMAAKGRCQMCGTSDSLLHGHHMDYGRMSKDGEADDICVLCENCHVSYHRKHKTPPPSKSARGKKLDDLSTALAEQGIDVSYFHANRILIDSNWMRSLSSTTREKEEKQKTKNNNEEFRYEKVTPEIIALLDCPTNFHAFLNVFHLKKPLRPNWKQRVIGKNIKTKTANKLRNRKKSWDKSQLARKENDKKRLRALATKVVEFHA